MSHPTMVIINYAFSHVLLKNAHGSVSWNLSASQTFHMWHVDLTPLLKRRAYSSDFVWLGRFRFLSIYTILKASLLLTAGALGAGLSSFHSGSTFNLTPHLWIGMTLGITLSTLFLISGIGVASQDKQRSIGLVMPGASDICVLFAIVYACILNNLTLLLIILVFVSYCKFRYLFVHAEVL